MKLQEKHVRNTTAEVVPPIICDTKTQSAPLTLLVGDLLAFPRRPLSSQLLLLPPLLVKRSPKAPRPVAVDRNTTQEI